MPGRLWTLMRRLHRRIFSRAHLRASLRKLCDSAKVKVPSGPFLKLDPGRPSPKKYAA